MVRVVIGSGEMKVEPVLYAPVRFKE